VQFAFNFFDNDAKSYSKQTKILILLIVILTGNPFAQKSKPVMYKATKTSLAKRIRRGSCKAMQAETDGFRKPIRSCGATKQGGQTL
jgi:hypothetical protein